MNLKAPCPHGRYEKHLYNSMGPHQVKTCPGGSLLPPDSLVIVKEDGEWPQWANVDKDEPANEMWMYFLDALAAAQRKEI